MSEWISVKDKLPHDQSSFLIYACGDICVAKLIKGETVTPNGVLIVYTTCGGKLATHWMPLPEPPEGT